MQLLALFPGRLLSPDAFRSDPRNASGHMNSKFWKTCYTDFEPLIEGSVTVVAYDSFLDVGDAIAEFSGQFSSSTA